jgi:hypothetical protein
MNTCPVSFPEHLSNQELIAALPLLVRRESQAIAELVAHLAEVDARRLYRDQAFPSMHQYCVDALHLCEGAAYKRITAARTARRFPIILDLLADGRLHLSAVCLLAPHLTEGNHSSLLEAAVHRSKRGVELLLAERFPRPDVPQSIRKLPVRQAATRDGSSFIGAHPDRGAASGTGVPSRSNPRLGAVGNDAPDGAAEAGRRGAAGTGALQAAAHHLPEDAGAAR